MIIYKVTNLVNGKVYIGKTINTLEKRKIQHISESNANRTKSIFHKALRKYGEDNFLWEIIDSAESENELFDKEKYYITFYHSYIKDDNSNGYNMTIGGEGISGLKFSEESKKKSSESHKGQIVSNETRKKISERFKGSNHPLSKLNEEEVLQIKEMLKDGMSYLEIAKEFNVVEGTISTIKQGRSWKHVGDDVSYITYSKIKISKLTEVEVKEIKSLLKEGTMTQKEIGTMYNVDDVTICHIYTGVAWKDVGEDMSKIHPGKRGNSKLTKEQVLQIKTLLKEGKLQKEIAKQFNVRVGTISEIKSGKTWKDVGEDLSYLKKEPLKESQVKEIKILLREGMKQKEIASKFNVDYSTINSIKIGRNWSHVEVY
jgi:group I intron endonuclease